MKKFMMYLLLLLPMALVSCGGDDEPKTNTTKDPDGTIVVNVNQGDDTSAGGCIIRLGKDYNLSSGSGISIVGPVKGIGNISATAASVQNLTWSSYAAAQVGYGYIFRISKSKWNEATREIEWGYCDYYAVYVVEEIGSTSGGVMGYTLKVRKLLEDIKEY